ncbi:hypothetical protein ISCGN_017160 [Ixodes scapularis]
MEQPHPFGNCKKDEVCLLEKRLYGLRQSRREWNLILDKLLKSEGIRRSKGDPRVYVSKEKKLIVEVYVDDFLITAEEEEEIADIKSQLGQKVDAKGMGEALTLEASTKEERATTEREKTCRASTDKQLVPCFTLSEERDQTWLLPPLT